LGLRGAAIRLEWRANPRVRQGQFVRTIAGGTPVHAASLLRERLMVLDSALLKKPRELRRILTHELFHFVWTRLANAERRGWEDLLAAERRQRARGELGWSAELARQPVTPDDIAGRTPRWRGYACESFCDTAAWLYSGTTRHPEYTLAGRFRLRRQAWFVELRRHHPEGLRI
jgi:hypothetical protein